MSNPEPQLRNTAGQDDAHSRRMRTFIDVQLGKKAGEMTPGQQHAALQRKFRRLMLMMGVNLAVVLFFSYSFYFDITRLGSTWFSLIIVFFSVNVLLLAYQWTQLKQALSWLEQQEKPPG